MPFTFEEIDAFEKEQNLAIQNNPYVETQQTPSFNDSNFSKYVDEHASNPKGETHGLFAGIQKFVEIRGEYLSNQLELGKFTPVRGLIGAQGMRQQRNDAEFAEMVNPKRIQELQSAVDKAKSSAELSERIGPLELPITKLLGDALNQTPYMMEVLKGSIGAGIGGAGVGAGIGLAAGNITGLGLALPEEFLTVPAGAATGFVLSAPVGGFVTTAEIEAGSHYADLVTEKGIDPASARFTAAGTGIASGVLEVMGGAMFAKAGVGAIKAARRAVGSPDFKNASGRFVKDYLTSIGVEVSTEVAQEIAQTQGEIWLNEWVYGSQNGNLPDKDDLFSEAAMAGYKEVAEQTFFNSLILSGILEGGGKLTGKAINTALKKGKEARLDELRRQIQDIQAEETEQTQTDDITKESDSTILDELAKPLFDEDGNIIAQQVGNVFQAGAKVIEEVSQTTDQVQQEITLENVGQAELTAEPLLPQGLDLEEKGRIRQIISDINVIDEKINVEERNMIARAADEKAITAVQNKINKLYEDRRVLDDELVAIREGDKTAIEGKIQLTAEQIQRAREKQTQRLVQQLRSGLKKGAILGRAEVQTVQNRLISAIEASDIALNDKAKFLRTVKNIQTPEQLEAALPDIQRRINQFVAKAELKRANKRISRLQKRIDLSKQSTNRPVGKFATGDDRGADLQQVLNWYSGAINNLGTAAQRVQALNLKDDLTTAELAEVRVLGQVLSVPSETRITKTKDGVNERVVFTDVAKLNALADEIQNIIERGRSEALEFAEKRQSENETLRSETVESAQGKVPATDQELNTWKNDFLKSTRVAFQELLPFEQLLHLVSQHDASHTLVKLLKTNKAMSTELRLREKYQGKIAKIFKESFKSIRSVGGINQKLVDDEKVNITLNYINIDGKIASRNVSRAQARKLWMEFQDPTLRNRFEAAESFTFEPVDNGKTTLEALEEALTEEDIAFAKAQLKLYQDFYKEVSNPSWRQRNGVDLPFNPNYSPIRAKGFKRDGTTEFLAESGFRAGLKPRSAISRQEVVTPIERVSDYHMLENHMNDWIQHEAWYETVRKIDVVLNNQEFIDVVRRKYGDQTLRLLRQKRENFVQGKKLANNLGFDIVRQLRRFTAIGYVAGKPDQLIKQFASVVTALEYVNGRELVEGTVDFLSNPKKVQTALRESDIFRTRGYNIQDDYAAVLNSGETLDFLRTKTFTKTVMVTTAIGDKAPGLTGGWAIYKKVLAETGSKEKALEVFDEFMETSQQSANKNQWDAFENQNDFVKLFLQFSKASRQYFNKTMLALRDYRNGNISAVEATKQVVIYWVVAPALFKLAQDLVFTSLGLKDLKDTGYDVLTAGLLGPATMLPLWGDLITMMGSLGIRYTFDPERKVYAPSSLFDDVQKDLYNVFMGKNSAIRKYAEGEDFDAEDVFDTLRSASKAAPLVAAITPGVNQTGLGLVPYQVLVNWFQTGSAALAGETDYRPFVGAVLTGKRSPKPEKKKKKTRDDNPYN